MNNSSGTFCPRCGKLRNHPTMEDKTVTAGLEVNIDWIDTEEHFPFGKDEHGDLFIFINHCRRCGYTMQAMSGYVLPSSKLFKEEFDSLKEYAEWLDDEIDEEWTEEPIIIDSDKILEQLPDYE